MAGKFIEIENNTTKTVKIKKDAVIKFSGMTEKITASDIKLNKKGRNLIITSSKNGINLTIKNFFVSKKKDVSKLSVTVSTASSSIDLYGFAKSRLEWTLKPSVRKKTFYGTMWADSVDYDTKCRKIYFYTGSDSTATSINFSQKYYFGDGSKYIYINPTKNDKTNITTRFYANEKNVLYLRDLQNSDLKYVSRKKNDLVLSNNKNHKIIFKNYLTKDNKYNIQAGKYTESTNSSTYKDLKTYINSLNENFRTQSLRKKGTLKGTYFNDILKGSTGHDKIYCVGGNNEVYSDIGNDKIYCGSGIDKIVFFENDGTDKIYNSTSSDILYMDVDDMTNFYKSVNNLVIAHRDIAFNKRDNIILVNYFKNIDNRLNTVWDYPFGSHGIDDATYAYNLTDKTITVNGTKKKETHNLGKGKYDIYLNGGKDTVIFDKTATGYINITQKQNLTEVEKQGNDAIFSYKILKGIKKGKNIYKTGGKLIVKNYFSTDLTSSGRAGSTINLTGIDIKNSTDDSTLDYIKKNVSYIKLTSSDLKEGDLYRIDSIKVDIPILGATPLDVQYYVAGNKKNERISINNKKHSLIDPRGGNDTVHAELGDSNKQNATICYSEGYDNYITGIGNDEYIIGAIAKSYTNIKKKSFNKNSKVHIRDKGGNGDVMKISAKTKDLRLLFNVNKQGKIVVNQNLNLSRNDADKSNNNAKYWDSLMIVNKSALTTKNIQKNNFTGIVEIDNWFATATKTTSAVNYNTRAEGYIETISTNNTDWLNMDSWIHRIAGDVAAWLNSAKNTKGYSTAADVFNSNDTASIKALVAIYNKVSYK